MKRVTTRSRDPMVIAHEVMRLATGQQAEVIEFPQPAKNPAAVALGRLGASKGGKARAKALSKARRSAIARKGGLNRWKNKTA